MKEKKKSSKETPAAGIKSTKQKTPEEKSKTAKRIKAVVEDTAAKIKAASDKADGKAKKSGEIKSIFPPAPDPKKAGPPFEFDNSNLAQNPIVNTLRFQSVAVYLCVAEKDGVWGASFRADIPASDSNPEGTSLGTDKPFVGGSSLGYSSREQAMYEAGRDALTSLQAHYSAEKGKGGKALLHEMEEAVKALQPIPSKRASSSDLALIGYRAQDAGKYMMSYGSVSPHHSGVILAESMPEEDFKNFGFALEHISQVSMWVQADWYNFGKEHFPKLVDTLLSEGVRQTIYNRASVGKKFAHDERRSGLSFTHHQEVAALTKAERNKWLDRAEKEGLSAARLRKLIQEGRNPAGTAPQAPPSLETAPGGTDTPSSSETPQGEAPEGGTDGSEFEEDQTPAQKAQADYEKLLELLDDAETLIRRGVLTVEGIKATQRHGIKVILQQMLGLVEEEGGK